MNPEEGVVALQIPADVIRCRQRVRQLAEKLGFSVVGQTKIATAASELARNTIVYGKGGQMTWNISARLGRRGLTLVFEDHGPGIPDLALALTDGWSSGRSLGLGLSGSRRLVDEFDLATSSLGTRITVSSWR